MTDLDEAVEQLTDHQTQLDADGIMVGVSRQALDIVFAALAEKALANTRYRSVITSLRAELINANGALRDANEEILRLLAALKSTVGYMLNAQIDLEAGAPKKTAIATIASGITLARAAIAKAEGVDEVVEQVRGIKRAT